MAMKGVFGDAFCCLKASEGWGVFFRRILQKERFFVGKKIY